MRKYLLFAFSAALASGALHGETPNIVLPVPPVNQTGSALWVSFDAFGIDPDHAVFSGALRGEVLRDGDRLVYLPDRARFLRTGLDLFRVTDPSVGAAWNVVVIESSSGARIPLVAHAAAAEAADPGWQVADDAVWDPDSGTYLVMGEGEVGFDFARDGVVERVLNLTDGGAQSGSGSSVTLRPPPPPPPLGIGTAGSILIYQGGGVGGDVWELWFHPGAQEMQLVLTPAAGDPAQLMVPVPSGPALGVELDAFPGSVEFRLSGSTTEAYYSLSTPDNFSIDRTWHHFGNLGTVGGTLRGLEAPLGLDDLGVRRPWMDLALQTIALDDFDAPVWASTWHASENGALRLGTDSAMTPGPWTDGALIASLDLAQTVGPDYLTRTLEVPRLEVTCRLTLDLSSLEQRGDQAGRATVLALRDESQQDPLARDYARLLVGRHGDERRVRLRALGVGPNAATPWIPLQQDSATLEMSWRKSAPTASHLELWIAGCGPNPDACATGWQTTATDEHGLVTAMHLGAVGDFVRIGGAVRFDDVVCAGDSWLQAE